MKIINQYILSISKVKDELEHSGRTFLQNLLAEFAGGYKVEIVHEPKRDASGKGAPDFKFLFNDTDIGYLENKKISENLDEVLKSRQIQKYKQLTNNLILTDYLRWIWIYKDEVVKDIRLCEADCLGQASINLNEQNCNDLADLINDFLSQKPQQITKARDLAEKLSRPTRVIKEEVSDIVKDVYEESSSKIIGTYKVFKSEISDSITAEDFADAFAQTLTYSLFLTKITQGTQEKLSLSNIANLTPKSFALIKDILAFIGQIEYYPQLKPYIEKLFYIINNTNATEVVKDLQSSKNEFEDPYIHFYENFLTAYDPEKRKDLGVWYTPKPIVRSIINNIDKILKNDFNMGDGISDPEVKILDFACGTGTFLCEIYDKILSSIPKTSLKKSITIKEHILKNIFGFELLIPAYCVSHLKLSQHLKEDGYYPDDSDRIGVYFTNTLESKEKSKQANLDYQDFFPAVAKEGSKAQSIKDDNGILVITGNPPYNGSSKNNFDYIKKLIKPYFPQDGIAEKNPKWLQDDYVKFIRFAEDKISKAGRGVVGIITNHSFMDNPTFRAMRKHLMETFDKIYIIDLHGNSKKKEKCPDGTPDQNVFDIQQGVAISFFVKTGSKDKCNLNHAHIYGKRESKFKQISEIDLQTSHFTKIEPVAPFYLFTPQDAELRDEYDKGISLRDIFIESGVGITTAHDDFVIDISKDNLFDKFVEFKNSEKSLDLHKKFNVNKKEGWDILKAWDELQEYSLADINNLICKINYRPFDTRHIIYHDALVWRIVKKMANHFVKKPNIGLVFVRNQQGTSDYDNAFVSDKIIDLHVLPIGASIAPLYLYNDELGIESKIPNFKPEFLSKLKQILNPPLEGGPVALPSGRGLDGESTENSFELQQNSNPPLEGVPLGDGSELKQILNPPLEGGSKPVASGWGLVTETFNPSPEQILGYIYAILNSPSYRKKYLEFLKIDFAKIPFNASIEEFKKLASLGQELIDAHLMLKVPNSTIGEPKIDEYSINPSLSIADKSYYIVTKPDYRERVNRIYFNDFCYFDSVSPAVWNFKIGGYQVLDKYLKSRKGLDISGDLEHIQNIIKILDFSVDRMAEVDGVLKI